MSARPASLTVLGHSTVVIELAGRRFITDPVLRDRVGHLKRGMEPVAADALDGIDAALVSHVHHDHLDGPSLRRLGTRVPVVVPAGARRLVRSMGMRRMLELSAGDEVEVAGTRILAVPADHHTRRLPGSRAVPALGYVVGSGLRVYFAGDSDRFAGMQAIGDLGLDVAVLPVAGWGSRLPPGHMDPVEAAAALRLLRPRIAVPIHWGTFAPVWWRPQTAAVRRAPAVRFAEEAAAQAPEVEVHILDDGMTLRLA